MRLFSRYSFCSLCDGQRRRQTDRVKKTTAVSSYSKREIATCSNIFPFSWTPTRSRTSKLVLRRFSLSTFVSGFVPCVAHSPGNILCRCFKKNTRFLTQQWEEKPQLVAVLKLGLTGRHFPAGKHNTNPTTICTTWSGVREGFAGRKLDQSKAHQWLSNTCRYKVFCPISNSVTANSFFSRFPVRRLSATLCIAAKRCKIGT